MDNSIKIEKSENSRKVIKSEIVCLILGFLSCIMFGIFTGLPAVVIGHISLYRLKRKRQKIGDKRILIAGTILGYFGIFLFFILCIYLFMIYSDPKNYWSIL
jgi:cyanate permease